MLKKSLLLVPAAILAGAAFAGEPTPAASTAPGSAVTFAQLDANRDGVLSFTEVFQNPRLSNNFNVLDTNADGVLSPGEVRDLVRL